MHHKRLLLRNGLSLHKTSFYKYRTRLTCASNRQMQLKSDQFKARSLSRVFAVLTSAASQCAAGALRPLTTVQ